MSRGILRYGVFGQHFGLRGQGAPATGEIEVELLAQLALGTNIIAITDS
jgi:hypothetical protein